MAECHIHNTPSPHRARHCGLVVYMAFSHEVTCQPGSEEQHKIFFSGCRPHFSRLARSFAARRSRAGAPEEKRETARSLEEFMKGQDGVTSNVACNAMF